MDTNQLLTIVITTVVATITKEVVSWLLKKVKTFIISDTAKTTSRRFLNTRLIEALYALFWLVYWIRLLQMILYTPALLTKLDVAGIAVSVLTCAYWLYWTIKDSTAYFLIVINRYDPENTQ